MIKLNLTILFLSLMSGVLGMQSSRMNPHERRLVQTYPTTSRRIGAGRSNPSRSGHKESSLSMNFDLDDATITVTSRPLQVDGMNMHTMVANLERILPTKNKEWSELKKWTPAIANLRRQDIKLAKAIAVHPEQINDRSEFQLQFNVGTPPNSCHLAKEGLESLMDDFSVKFFVGLFFKDPQALLERILFITADSVRCHEELLSLVVVNGRVTGDVQLAMSADGVNIGTLRDQVNPVFNSQATDAAGKNVWKKRALQNGKKDAGKMNRLFKKLAHKMEHHDFSGKEMAALMLLILSLSIPLMISMIPVGVAARVTQKAHRVGRRLSRKGVPVFLPESDLNKIAATELMIREEELAELLDLSDSDDEADMVQPLNDEE